MCQPFDCPRRLIPACAGKTRSQLRTAVIGTAHPRECGENGLQFSIVVLPPGSSPRVRGKLSPRQRLPAAVWLIPACAGKTAARESQSGADWAHPRVCGENIP